MKPFAIACLALALAGSSHAGVRLYEGAQNNTALRLLPQGSGGLVVLGQESSPRRPWLAEISADGTILRQVRFVNDAADPSLTGILATSDGGFILVGGIRARATSDPYDALVVKLDASWNLEWQVSHGADNGNEFLADVVATSDGGWLASGRSGSGMAMLLRLDAAGSVSWMKHLDADNGAFVSLEQLVPTGADRFLGFGMAQGSVSTENELFLADVDADGRLSATRVVGGPSYEWPEEVAVMPDGSAWVLAQTQSFTPPGVFGQALVMRLLPNGTLAWARGVSATEQVSPRTFAPTPDGGIVFSAEKGSSRDGTECQVVKLDATGAFAWNRLLGGARDDRIMDLATGRAGFVACGSTYSFDVAGAPADAWILELDDTGGLDASCGLDRTNTVTVVVATPTVTVIGVSEVPRATGSSGVGVVADPGALTTTAPCVDPPSPPSEVSPPGAATPLRVTASQVLTWEDGALSGSDTFDVHRGEVRGLRSRDYGACWRTSLPSTTTLDAELPGVGNCWFYLVAGRNGVGLGPLGWDSQGAERVPPARCP